MKQIDFSNKHHILLKNEDGTFSPMDEPYFKSKKIAEDTYQILSDGDYSYLIIGVEEAVVIDSGYGAGNIREYAQSLTDKPIYNILNTHDHFDHTANNSYFDCAYMSKETHLLATIPFPSFEGIVFPRDYKVKIIEDGFVYPLKGRALEAFFIPDHAAGSMAFLDKKAGILFAGDEIGMPMGKRLNGSVEEFLGYMEKLQSRRAEFDMVCAGFGIMDAEIINKYVRGMKYILEGHEGKALEIEEKKENHPEGPNGEIVYTRRDAHFPDMPQEDPKENPYKRVMDYADCRIIYDIRKIKK